MRAFKAENMTELHAGLCDSLALAPASKLDMVTPIDVQIHDVIAQAATMEWDFDLKDMWLTKSRWSVMVRQYLDAVELVEWINKCAALINWKGRGIGVLRTKTVKPRGGGDLGNKQTRRWGSCMLSISYKALPEPTITLHSRTSYLGYLAGLDLSVAWMCGNYLATVMGGDVSQIKFIWMNEAMQYHTFKSLAYYLNHPHEDKRDMYRHLLIDELDKEDTELIEGMPALLYSRRWVQKSLDEDKAGKTLGDITYNTYRRIKRRFHTEVFGYDYAQQFEGWSYWKKGPNIGEQRDFYKAYEPLPSIPIQSLDFTPLGLPPIDNLDSVDSGDIDISDVDEDEDD